MPEITPQVGEQIVLRSVVAAIIPTLPLGSERIASEPTPSMASINSIQLAQQE
jgi:hypothetical protein